MKKLKPIAITFVILLLGFAVADPDFVLPARVAAQKETGDLKGREALEHLAENNFFDSLQTADGPDTWLIQQAKLAAADGASQDNLAFSVAVSGDTAIVGAPRDQVGANVSQGSAYVYVRTGAAWTQQQKLTASDGTTGDQFGYAVAISGDTAVVGRQNTVTGSNRGDGKLYVFTRTGTVWTETQTIVSSDIAQGDLFGNALALEGDTMLVGALNKTNGANFFQGAVYVFTRSGGSFTQQAKLLAGDGAANDFFGYSVALSGDTAVVGAVEAPLTGIGKAYVFVRSGSNWSQQAKLLASDGAAGDAFGFSVGVSGDYAIIGARLDDIGAVADQGSAYIFARSGSTWTEQQKLLGIELTQRNDQFGYAVAISGNTAVVGSPAHEIISGVTNHGAVYVFNRSGSVWNRTQKLVHSDPSSDALGQAVAFDGSSVLAGAPAKSSNRGYAYVFNSVPTKGQSKLVPPEVFGGALFGHFMGSSEDTVAVGSNLGTYIYTRSGAGWSFTQKLTSFTENGGANNIQPTSAFAFVGDMMIVGAQGSRINSVNLRGAVLVYRRNASGLWVEHQRLLASDGGSGDLFGSSVAVSGNTLVVGASNDTVGSNTSQGSVYVFTFDGSLWTEQQKLTSSDGAQNDRFGSRLAVSADTIVVGVPDKTIGGNVQQGAVYVYARTGSAWTEQQRLVAPDGRPAGQLGTGVAVVGNTVVAGSPGAVGANMEVTGAAYVFGRTGATWTHQQKIFDLNGRGGDNFGMDLAVSGDRLYIGASATDHAPNWMAMGSVYVYQTGAQGWRKRGKLAPFDPDHNKQLGYKVSIAGNYLVATAVAERNYGVSNSGAGYVFDLTQVRFSSPEFDFDGDGSSDLSVFRPAERNWYLNRSSAGFAAMQFGLATDRLTPADFDGDGRTDIAVWREGAPDEAGFFIFESGSSLVRFEPFGQTGDVPAVIGDWDGDGKADPAVYRENASGSQSFFYYRGSQNNPNGSITYLPWGTTGDRPQRGDFDGDGRLDLAVYRPSSGVWYIFESSTGTARYESWGLPTDKFVPADYDGDGRTDPAVFRDGIWYIRQSSDGQPRYLSFGLAGDLLVPADYDGDGSADAAVYRAGVWYIRQSSNDSVTYGYFGTSSDQPVPNAFVR